MQMTTSRIWLVLFLFFSGFWTACHSSKKSELSASSTASKNKKKSYEGYWAVVDSLFDQGLYKSAYGELLFIQKQSLKENNEALYLKSWMKYESIAKKENIDYPDAFLSTIAKESVKLPQFHWFFTALRLDVLMTYYKRWSWKINNNIPSSSPVVLSCKEWTSADYNQAFDSLIQQCLTSVPELQKKKPFDFSVYYTTAQALPSEWVNLSQAYLFWLLNIIQLPELNEKQLSVLLEPVAFIRLSIDSLLSSPEQPKEYIYSSNSFSKYGLKVLQLIEKDFIQYKSIEGSLSFYQYRLSKLSNLDYVTQAGANKRAFVEKQLLYLIAQHKQTAWQGIPLLGYVTFLEKLAPDSSFSYRLKAYSLAETFIQDYPQSKFANDMRLFIRMLKQVELQAKISHTLLADTPIPLRLRTRNTDKYYYKYVPIETEYYHTYSKEGFKELLQNDTQQWMSGSVCNSKHYYTEYTDLFLQPQKQGMYLLCLASDSLLDSATVREEHIITVSKYKIIAGLAAHNSASIRAYVVDAASGAPVIGAQVKVSFQSDNTWKYWTQEKSDNEGMFSFKYPSKQNLFFLPSSNRYPIANYKLEIGQGSSYEALIIRNPAQWIKDPEKIEPQKVVRLYTDRSIYRPGQEVYFKGIIVKEKEYEAEATVLKNEKIMCYLQKNNYDKLDSLELISNDFGSFSGKFILSKTAFTESYFINTPYGRAYFRVEEYKRPTYDLQFVGVDSNARLDQEVKATIKTQYYSGAIPSGTRITYNLNVFVHSPWRGKFGSYVNTTTVKTGELQTDGKGEAVLQFFAASDTFLKNNKAPIIQRYEWQVVAVDPSGERKEKSFFFELSNATRRISLELPEDKMFRQGQDIEMKVRHTGIGGKIIQAEGVFQIEKLKTPDHSKLDFPFSFTTRVQKPFNKDTFHLYHPYHAYYNQFSIEELEVESVVRTERIQTSTTKLSYDAEAFTPTKAGYYRVWTEYEEQIADSLYRFYEVAYLTVLNTKDIKGLPGTKLSVIPMVHKPSHVYAPGSNVALFVQTGFLDQASVFYTITSPNGIEVQGKLDLQMGGGVLQFKTSSTPGMTYKCYITGYFRGEIVRTQYFFKTEKKESLIALQASRVRDFSQPGANENWAFSVMKDGKSFGDVEVLASMYDKSLDALYLRNWEKRWVSTAYPIYFEYYHPQMQNQSFDLFPKPNPLRGIPKTAFLFPDFNTIHWFYPIGTFSPVNSNSAYFIDGIRTPSYSWSWGDDEDAYGDFNSYKSSNAMKFDRVEISRLPSRSSNSIASLSSGFAFSKNEEDDFEGEDDLLDKEADQAAEAKSIAMQTRKDFRETAFFYPHLRPNAQGELTIGFTMPDAVTTWKFRAMTHDKAMRQHTFELDLVSRKDLMVQARLPRFFRIGDSVEIRALVSNLTDNKRNVVVVFEVTDTENTKPVFRLLQNYSMGILPQQSIYQSTFLKVPSESSQLELSIALFEINEKGKQVLLDKELHYLPVMEDKQRTREGNTMGGSQDFTVAMPTQLQEDAQVEIHIEASPLHTLLKTLPALSYFEHNCSEQTVNKLFGQLLAGHLLQHPDLQFVAERTSARLESDTGAVAKWLKKRTIVSGEWGQTPWSHLKGSAALQQIQFLTLLQPQERKNEIEKHRHTLLSMQLDEGSWPWFAGFPHGNEQITYEILLGFDRIQQWEPLTQKERRAIERALYYLFDAVKKEKAPSSELFSATQFRFLDAISKFKGVIADTGSVVQRVVQHAQEALRKGMEIDRAATTVLALHALGKVESFDQLLLQRLTENAVVIPHRGVTWNFDGAATFYGFQHAIEKQAMAVEVLRKLGKTQEHKQLLQETAQFLLTMKKGNEWGGTKDAAKAVHELSKYYLERKEGTIWPQIIMDNQPIPTEELKAWGSITLRFKADEVPRNLQVKTQGRPVWVATTWEETVSVETPPRIAHFLPPFSLQAKYFKVTKADGVEKLIPIHDTGKVFKGDLICVVMDIKVRSFAEFIHVSHARPCILEPTDALSGYIYADGLSFYRRNTDTHTDFYIGSMHPGSYKLKTYFSINQSGHALGGLSTLQHMYLPEWSTYDKAHKIKAQ